MIACVRIDPQRLFCASRDYAMLSGKHNNPDDEPDRDPDANEDIRQLKFLLHVVSVFGLSGQNCNQTKQRITLLVPSVD